METLYDKRNYLPVTSLGDKSYRTPEWSSYFYEKGALIPGSSNIHRERCSGPSGLKIEIKIVPS